MEVQADVSPHHLRTPVPPGTGFSGGEAVYLKRDGGAYPFHNVHVKGAISPGDGPACFYLTYPGGNGGESGGQLIQACRAHKSRRRLPHGKGGGGKQQQGCHGHNRN